MFSILADGELLWRVDYEGHELFEPQWNVELNRAGTLTFDMPEYHPFYNKLRKLRTTIDLLDGETLVWRGRVLTDDGIDFDNIKSVYCEGALSFLNDSVVRPYDFSGTPLDYFTFLVEQHNNQVEDDRKFIVGKVNVTNASDFIWRASTQYPSTLSEMMEKLVKNMGGYLIVTFDAEGRMVLNYLYESGDISDQTISFGDNLVNVMQYIDASDVFTVIVPLGATIEEEVEGNG